MVLRLIHILAGVFWAGGALLMAAFVGPAVQAAGRPGGAVMQKLVADRRLPNRLAGTAVITVVAGLLLYWEVSGGLVGGWVTTPQGITITVGGVLGIAAAGIGVGIAAPASRRSVVLATEIQSAGNEPTPDEASTLARLRQRSTVAIRWVATLAFAAAGAMAIAEYI